MTTRGSTGTSWKKPIEQDKPEQPGPETLTQVGLVPGVHQPVRETTTMEPHNRKRSNLCTK